MFKCFDKSRKVMENNTVLNSVQEITPVKVEIVEKQETIQEESVITETPVIEPLPETVTEIKEVKENKKKNNKKVNLEELPVVENNSEENN